MIGAIIGDIAGSRFEFNNAKDMNFELFASECDYTDDTICTVAIADAVLGNGSYKDCLHRWCKQFPHPMGAYGSSFARWIASTDPQPYNSFGNGAAMRVSPIGWAFDDVVDVEREAAASASVSHNHPEGIKGAVATALAVLELRTSKSKECVRSIERQYYDVQAQYKRGLFDETCQGTVPVALRLLYNSSSFEDAIRLAMAWGGDSDTLGAIVGGMAEALYGIPADINKQALNFLPADMKHVIAMFCNVFMQEGSRPWATTQAKLQAKRLQRKSKQNALLDECRYYKGENDNPYDGIDQNKAMLWFYESCWVHDTSRAQKQRSGDVYGEYESEYIACGLERFNENDGVSISLKALLFNRYARTVYSMADAVEPFKVFYLKYYSDNPKDNPKDNP